MRYAYSSMEKEMKHAPAFSPGRLKLHLVYSVLHVGLQK